MPQKVIIDTDPGQDDAIALLLALASPELDVLGVTVVAGNVPLALTEANARRLVELAGREDVPVFAGCERPLVRPLVTAEYVHGDTGLDGANLPEPTLRLRDGHAVDWIIETLMREDAGSVTVCTLGPMTNLGMAIAKAPAVAARIACVVAMIGGGFEGGNVTPVAEFNAYVDPHAARIVFESGVPIIMAPLDLTHKALMPRGFLDRLQRLDTAVGRAAHGMLSFYERFDVEKYGSTGGPLHDPCVIAWLLAPKLFSGRECVVEVETASELTVGQTVIDWWGVTKRAPNALVLNEVEAESFFDLIVERLATLA